MCPNTPIIIKYRSCCYDITKFIDVHPGGRYLLTSSNGCDLTEVIQSYHSSSSMGRVERLFNSKYIHRISSFDASNNYTFSQSYVSARDAVYALNFSSCDPYNLIPLMCFLQYTIQPEWTSFWVLNGIVNGICMIILLGFGHQNLHTSSPLGSFITFADYNSQIWRRDHNLLHHPYTNTIKDHDLEMFSNIDKIPLPSIMRFIVTSFVVAFRMYFQWFLPSVMACANIYDWMCVMFNLYDIYFRFGCQFILSRMIFSTWFVIYDYFNHKTNLPLRHVSNDWATQQISTSRNLVFSRYLYSNHPFIHSLLTFGLDRQVEHHLFPKVRMEHLHLVTKYIPSQKINTHYLGLHSIAHIWNHFAWV